MVGSDIAAGSVASLLNHSAGHPNSKERVSRQGEQLNIVISMERHRDKR